MNEGQSNMTDLYKPEFKDCFYRLFLQSFNGIQLLNQALSGS